MERTEREQFIDEFVVPYFGRTWSERRDGDDDIICTRKLENGVKYDLIGRFCMGCAVQSFLLVDDKPVCEKSNFEYSSYADFLRDCIEQGQMGKKKQYKESAV